MMLQQLKPGDKFIFESSQIVQTTTYSKGEMTWVEKFGRATKGEVLKVNARSVRVRLYHRDKDKPAEKLSMRFRGNEDVRVQLI